MTIAIERKMNCDNTLLCSIPANCPDLVVFVPIFNFSERKKSDQSDFQVFQVRKKICKKKKKIEKKNLKKMQPTLPDGDVYMKEMSWQLN